MVSCAVIFISASEVSVAGDRCDLVFPALWLPKIWASMQFVRGVFVALCGGCPVSPTPTNSKSTLRIKLGWSGARAVLWWWFYVLPPFWCLGCWVLVSCVPRRIPMQGPTGTKEAGTPNTGRF